MKNLCLPVFLLLFSVATLGQGEEHMIPQTVEFPSGTLHLKAYLWKPTGPGPFPAILFSHGSGGNEADVTAGMQITESADILAPFFIKHGYAFLYPFRRGHGPSADQARFMQDVLRREEKEKGREARQHLQFKLLTTDQLDDVMAALAFLKTVPGVDIQRIAVAGNSFGGQLTLLAAERDSTIRAVVTFAAAAGSWERSAELRDRLLTAVRKTNAAIMLIHAENDYSTAAGRALADELERLHKPHSLKIYPKVGLTSDDGHNVLYENIPAWEDDVFNFLDQHAKGLTPHPAEIPPNNKVDSLRLRRDQRARKQFVEQWSVHNDDLDSGCNVWRELEETVDKLPQTAVHIRLGNRSSPARLTTNIKAELELLIFIVTSNELDSVVPFERNSCDVHNSCSIKMMVWNGASIPV